MHQRQWELLSLAMIAVSLGSLSIALIGGAWLVVYDHSLPSWGQAIVIGTAYVVGWLVNHFIQSEHDSNFDARGMVNRQTQRLRDTVSSLEADAVDVAF